MYLSVNVQSMCGLKVRFSLLVCAAQKVARVSSEEKAVAFVKNASKTTLEKQSFWDSQF